MPLVFQPSLERKTHPQIGGLFRRGGAISQRNVQIVTSVAPPPSYSFTEYFEGSNTDSLGVAGYDNTGWTSNNVANNPDYATSPAPLQGAHSMRFTTSTRTISRSVATGLRSVFFQINIGAWNTSNTTFGIRASAARIAGINTGASGTTFRAVNGTVVSAGGASLSISTTYWVWMDYTPGSGANGITRIYVSTDATKPGTVYAEVTNGDATAEADELVIGGLGTTSIIWDSVIWNTSVIGSNP